MLRLDSTSISQFVSCLVLRCSISLIRYFSLSLPRFLILCCSPFSLSFILGLWCERGVSRHGPHLCHQPKRYRSFRKEEEEEGQTGRHFARRRPSCCRHPPPRWLYRWPLLMKYPMLVCVLFDAETRNNKRMSGGEGGSERVQSRTDPSPNPPLSTLTHTPWPSAHRTHTCVYPQQWLFGFVVVRVRVAHPHPSAARNAIPPFLIPFLSPYFPSSAEISC